ncbi:MAG: PIN domain-containing protein [Candidatus Methylomirabilis sp.]
MGPQTDPPAILRPRLFLDANVLFSACVSHAGRAAALIELARVRACDLVSSPHAIEETRRNLTLRYPENQDRLPSILEVVTAVPEAPPELVQWARDLGLPEQDAPILAAAVHAQADSLVTGDRIHFGRFFGQVEKGVSIVALSDTLIFLESL